MYERNVTSSEGGSLCRKDFFTVFYKYLSITTNIMNRTHTQPFISLCLLLLLLYRYVTCYTCYYQNCPSYRPLQLLRQAHAFGAVRFQGEGYQLRCHHLHKHICVYIKNYKVYSKIGKNKI